jgi:hypothetical protein
MYFVLGSAELRAKPNTNCLPFCDQIEELRITIMLFMTARARNRIMAAPATLIVLWATLKEKFTEGLLRSIFSAKTNISPAETVTINFTVTKAGRFVLTKPAINGLISRVPKYRVPSTVVKQSNEPNTIKSKPEKYFTNKNIPLQAIQFLKSVRNRSPQRLTKSFKGSCAAKLNVVCKQI